MLDTSLFKSISRLSIKAGGKCRKRETWKCMYKEHREIDNKVLIEILGTIVERDATADNQNIIRLADKSA